MKQKPDASKQFKNADIFYDYDAMWEGGPWCVNCELSFKSFEDMPADCPLYFCGHQCMREWNSKQPLQNLLDKRKTRRERSNG